MAVKIRLMRIGAKRRPFYRVVAVDERKKRTGSYLELLGTYNPLTEPKEINLKQDRIDVWVKNGAQMSTGFLRIIGKAPQKPPRKPKKVRAEKPAEAPAQPAPAEVAAQEAVPEETPAAEEAPVVEETNNETPTDVTDTTNVEAAEAETTPAEPEKE